ncbi:MAG: glutaminase [Candidatus Scalindua rubra]|uniref:Glutaminase n=1 Tax=Candidatus Scalindua brodae TaxID=237368 RepID=A0A0B0EMV1_9BACT|nr:MAG: Thermolabile glutaminase [Candidatus Scalindua brodae]MBZ0110733.1 glutaminase [Candidatus Scalindua rubra]
MIKNIDYQKIFREIADELKNVEDSGEVATYIPELSNVDPGKLGIHLASVQGDHYFFGDSNEKFSIQSISKVLSLTLALKIAGESVWDRVGVEPSGTAFNSLVQLEYERGIPRNPLINAGAIVICDILVSLLDDPKFELLDFVRRSTGISGIGYSPKVAVSEMRTGYRNYSLANLMKDFGNIHNDIDPVLDLYFHLCSIEMSCEELAQSFLFLASDGVNPMTNEIVTMPRRTKRINSIMQMCGFYDEAGEFAFRTGLPGKSGVGGGIVAIHPGEYSVAVWSPKLNKNGNSYKGMKVLESLTTKTQSSIF